MFYRQLAAGFSGNFSGQTVTASSFTWTNGTQGSVLFVGPSGVITQDNSNFFWDDTNNQLELGNGSATNPSYSFKNFTTSGMYAAAGPVVIIAANGSDVLRCDLNTIVYANFFVATKLFGGGVTGRTSASALEIDGGSSTTARGLTFIGGGSDFAATSGTQSGAYFNYSGAGNRFAPASGNANFFGLDLAVEISQTGSASGTYVGYNLNVTETAYLGSASALLINLAVGGTTKFAVTRLGLISAAETAVTTGTMPTMIDITGAAHTGLTPTASQDVNFNFNVTRTFNSSGGTVTDMSNVVIRPSTYAAGAATTITVVSGLTINAPPAAGSNITITNSYTIWAKSKIRVDSAVALGGGAGATLGTIGATGPATAAQNEWLEVHTQNGKRFAPLWA